MHINSFLRKRFSPIHFFIKERMKAVNKLVQNLLSQIGTKIDYNSAHDKQEH